MSSSNAARLLAALSIAWPASAQTPAPKPKPTRKPAVAAKPAVEKTAEVAPPVPAPPPTDVKVRTTYVSGAQVSENTTYLKGVRQRFEFPGITMIAQCDLKRSVELQDATKHFMIVSTEPAAGRGDRGRHPRRGQPCGAGAAPKGGVIAETITLTDTGERKQMFGLEARHIKTLIVRQPGANACDSKTTRIETDGWYADLPEHAACAAASPDSASSAGGPTGLHRSRRNPANRRREAGFRAQHRDDDDRRNRQGRQGQRGDDDGGGGDRLQVTSLDAALFDVPPGYTEVRAISSCCRRGSGGGTLADAVFGSIADGTSTVAPKKPGVIRIGVVESANSSGRTMPTPMLRGGLVSSLSKAPFEAVPISGATPADLDRDASNKACDFVLVSDIAEVKTSKPNKVGGLLKKVSGDANASAEVHDARVDYKLYAVGDQASRG